MSSTANRVIKNTGYLYAKMGITMFVSLYTTRLILSGLGASDFGIFNIVGGAIAMLGFLNAAMASATQRFMNYAEGEGNKEKQKYIFNISIVLHAAIAVIVGIALVGVGWFFFNGILTIPENRVFAAEAVYASLIVSAMFTVMSVPYDAVLNAHENMRYYAIVGIIESLLKLTVAFVCVYTAGDKLIVYGVLMAIIPVITLSVMRIYCKINYQECRLSFKRYYRHSIAKEMAGFAGWNFIYTASSMLTMQGMAILLNIFGGVVVNAAHGIANQLSGQLMVFSNNMLKALNPVLVKSKAADQNDHMLESASIGNKMSFLILSLLTIPFIVETPYILSLWLKNPPEWTVTFVRLVLIREMVIQTYITYETCIMATGKVRKFMISSSLIWLSPLIIGYVFYKLGAPIYTIYVLLILMAFARGLNVLMHLRVLCELKIANFIKDVFLPCTIATATVLLVVVFITNNFCESFPRLILTLVLTFLIYPIVSYRFVLNVKERTLTKNTIDKFKVQLK